MEGEQKYDAEFYLRAGIPKSFVAKMFIAPNERLWVPSLGELIEAGLVTHVRTGTADVPVATYTQGSAQGLAELAGTLDAILSQRDNLVGAYLRHVPEEANRIRRALTEAYRAGGLVGLQKEAMRQGYEIGSKHLARFLVATADERTVYVHVIQRHAGETLTVRVDLAELGVTAAEGTRWTLSHRNAEERERSGDPAACGVCSRPVEVTGGILVLDLPPRTAHVVEVPLPSRAGGRGAAARD